MVGPDLRIAAEPQDRLDAVLDQLLDQQPLDRRAGRALPDGRQQLGRPRRHVADVHADQHAAGLALVRQVAAEHLQHHASVPARQLTRGPGRRGWRRNRPLPNAGDAESREQSLALDLVEPSAHQRDAPEPMAQRRLHLRLR